MFQPSRRVLTLAAVAGAFAPARFALSAEPQFHQVEIREFAFAPLRIVMRLGDSVRWTNRDFAPHTATGDSGDWTSEEMGNGASASFTPAKVGAYSYHCAYHPHMQAVIVVEAAD